VTLELPTRRYLIAGALAACALHVLAPARGYADFVRHVRRLLLSASGRPHADVAAAHVLVFGTAERAHSPLTLSAAEISACIRANASADYRGGRIENVSGWMISRTESRALALKRRLQLA
jgi:hypothetical protein